MRLVNVQNVPGLSGVYGTHVTSIPVAFAFPESVVVVVPDVDVELDEEVDVELTVVVVVEVVVALFPSLLLSLLPPQAARKVINMPIKIKPIIFFIVFVSLRLSSPSNFRNAMIAMIMQKSNNLDRKIMRNYIGIVKRCQFVLKSICFF